MLLLARPSAATLDRFVARQAKSTLTYVAVGATAAAAPAGFDLDHTRVCLGQGEAVFQRARTAIGEWRQFRLGWVEPWPCDTPLETGRVVAVLARVACVWWLNACRIVYVIDEQTPVRRFGFAYGTLAGHAEMGEERFVVERDTRDDRVWFDILAFSRPRHILARLAYPWARTTQRRFAREAAAAMQRAVA